jgi:RNA polymerase sigma-70 factor (ECF subfamily)
MDETWKVAASAAMERYACGDDAAFSELYDLLAPRLSSFLARRVRDAARTEDLVQQTFLQMHCARRHFARGAQVTPWAYAIARRLLIDGLRKSGRELLDDDERERRADEHAARHSGSEQLVACREIARHVQRKLEEVPETQRAAFELVHFDGLTAAEAAQVLGTTVMAVRLRIHRALEALRSTLGDEMSEEFEGRA